MDQNISRKAAYGSFLIRIPWILSGSNRLEPGSP